MALSPGDPAADNDVWLRAITNSNHIRSTGLHHVEFKNKKWFGPPSNPGATWKVELSGRLLSILDSISTDARRRVEEQRANLRAKGKNVPSSIQYCGVIYNVVSKIRAAAWAHCDVLYHPEPDDNAHANIVFLDRDMSQILTLIDLVSELLVWVPDAQVAQHPDLAPKA